MSKQPAVVKNQKMNQTGYSPKDLSFGQEGRKKLIDGISKMASAVKSTLGPGGNTVVIESPNHTRNYGNEGWCHGSEGY